MEFDYLFEHHNKCKNHGHYEHDSHRNDQYDYVGRRSEYNSRKHHLSYFLLNKIWTNPKLRLLAIILAISITLIVIVLVVALVPLLFKLVDFILSNGIQGVYDVVSNFIEKLWKGTGK